MTDDYDSLALTQRYKAAVHYTTGKICEEIATAENIHFTKQFIATLSESTFRYMSTLSTDLELFAKHGKRSVINMDDVKLAVRKSPTLLNHLEEKCPPEEKKSRKKNTKKKAASKSTTVEVEEENEDSNMGDAAD